ncbi:hypothetical protein NGM99_14050 [Mesorhizobium sp. RP14(2022)]|uniref:Uncharacterized protein n=1 Tax=Mesorhizobium liriopis TaxID=2953882 RepID=A0ABT1C8S6_9HYPH|nr:hypothetical protein [Mesorhizobium liriopis]MCO6050903.1 hypothetical protein [Mesorhizobium liriopis]
MLRQLASFAAAALALGGIFAPQPAFSADPISIQVDPGVCAEQRYLGRIVSRFDYQVRHVPNLPQVGIESFYNITERRYEPTDDWHPISRRYCTADVVLSDGQRRDIDYLIETDMGFASIGNSVEFCVEGFDRWYVYNGGCRVLK